MEWEPKCMIYEGHLDRAPFMWGLDVAREIASTYDSMEAQGLAVVYPGETLTQPWQPDEWARVYVR